jgi:phosphoglycolate phosphatase-like HAD superfamily hydrolase
VTNLPNWLVQVLLRKSGLNSLFGALVCEAGKPGPNGLVRCLFALQHGAGPDTFYVGDKQNDAEAAESAGISFAWVSYGYGKTQPRGVDIRLDRFAEVLHL